MSIVAVANDIAECCPICAGASFEECGTRSEYAQNTKTCFRFDFDDVICNACSFVFSRNRPQSEYLEKYYKDYFPSLSLVSKDEIDNRISAIAAHTSLDIDVLEYGGGFSTFAKELTSRGARVGSIEPSQPVTAETKKYDVVCSYYVAEHVPDLEGWMIEQTSHLRDGGLLVIEVPNFAAYPFESMNNEHVNHFKPSDLFRLLAKFGLVTIDHSPHGGRYFGMWAIGRKGAKRDSMASVHLEDHQQSRTAFRTFIKERDESTKLHAALRSSITRWASQRARVAVWPCNVVTTRLLTGIGDEVRASITPFDISPEKQGLLWAGTSKEVRYPEPKAFKACDYFVLCSPVHNKAIGAMLEENGIHRSQIFECSQ